MVWWNLWYFVSRFWTSLNFAGTCLQNRICRVLTFWCAKYPLINGFRCLLHWFRKKKNCDCIQTMIQWRVLLVEQYGREKCSHVTSGGSKGGRRGRAPPLGVQILSILCSFWEKSTNSYVGAPPGELAPPPRGNPGSATGNRSLSETVILLAWIFYTVAVKQFSLALSQYIPKNTKSSV